MTTTARFGSWESPISPEDLVAGSVSLGDVRVDSEGRLLWAEGRPAEAGRVVIVRQEADGTRLDLMPEGFNARTSVHEYGGGAWNVVGKTLYFANFADQRLYRVDLTAGQSTAPQPITPEPAHPRGDRYADLTPTRNGRFLICVRERHSGEPGPGPDGMVEAVNELVAVSTDATADIQVLASGHDFYASPRLSADGRRLTWQTWNHPNMPWDGAELWVADLELAGAAGLALRNETVVAGGSAEAVTQPGWLADGSLVFASDRSNWWNLYRWTAPTGVEPLLEKEAEFAGPQWGFAGATWCTLPSGKLVVTWGELGRTRLGVLDPAHPGQVNEIEVPFTALGSVATVDETHVATTGAAPDEFTAVAIIDLTDGSAEICRRARDSELAPGNISAPEAIEFPTLDGDKTAHAFYYAPCNPEFAGPEEELPPLVVMVHGGPTGAVGSTLNLGIQFWTSRGFAVVDVNYGGSAGFGREYRERLNGTWGVVDVEDCFAAGKFLAERGDVDGERIVIRGGSAGGWTTMVAAIRPDLGFAAGCSLFGISDLEVFVRDTHKFESRYIDRLVGTLPEAKAVYHERSAVHHADKIEMPLLLLQGLDDKIVPPNQSELIFDSLRERGRPVAYVAFEGEGHGFRKAENVVAAYCAELSFYAQVLGFEPAGSVPRLDVHNLGPVR